MPIKPGAHHTSGCNLSSTIYYPNRHSIIDGNMIHVSCIFPLWCYSVIWFGYTYEYMRHVKTCHHHSQLCQHYLHQVLSFISLLLLLHLPLVHLQDNLNAVKVPCICKWWKWVQQNICNHLMLVKELEILRDEEQIQNSAITKMFERIESFSWDWRRDTL